MPLLAQRESGGLDGAATAVLRRQPDRVLADLARDGVLPAFAVLADRHRDRFADAGDRGRVDAALVEAWSALRAGADPPDVAAWLTTAVRDGVPETEARPGPPRDERADAVLRAELETLLGAVTATTSPTPQDAARPSRRGVVAAGAGALALLTAGAATAAVVIGGGGASSPPAPTGGNVPVVEAARSPEAPAPAGSTTERWRGSHRTGASPRDERQATVATADDAAVDEATTTADAAPAPAETSHDAGQDRDAKRGRRQEARKDRPAKPPKTRPVGPTTTTDVGTPAVPVIVQTAPSTVAPPETAASPAPPVTTPADTAPPATEPAVPPPTTEPAATSPPPTSTTPPETTPPETTPAG